jgi:hypothetical protein
MEKQVKNIKAILPPPPFHMVGDGFKVHNFFPSQPSIGLYGMSPFFLLDYNSKWILPPSDRPKGVGVHPHRGIETVTIAFHGKVAHHDSGGNSGIIGEGDVQWMTAGGGVLHKEYHEKEFSRTGGLFHMAQIWVNLPAKDKMTPAKYQAIENRQMGKFMFPGSNSHIDIVAGEYKGVKGPASTFSPIHMSVATMVKDQTADFSFPSADNTGMLVVEGDVQINDNQEVAEDRFILFDHDGDEIKVRAMRDCKVLVLSGKPLNETISAYGPFVMNTDAEIKEAYDDYYKGKFGYLED